uniref:Major facilitator superfamily (MFS) profile domain-containing protein n=1 Tax=Branchiostoma floridae TaxID=7739 RepID=C3Z6M2_BRAFL|eukprot:XP_002595854.1 hypothetical protein BRAFLDRAFT_97130 [Branchiostoma floridae]
MACSQKMTCGMSTRYSLAVLLMGVLIHFLTLRSNFSIIVVAMVKHSPNYEGNGSRENECYANTTENIKYFTNESITPELRAISLYNETEIFRHENSTEHHSQGRIIGAYSYGHVFSQVMGGFLEARFGGKKVLGLSILLSSVLTLLTPAAAFAGEWWLFVVRVVVGFVQGVVYPSTFGILSRWSPPLERGRLLAIVTVGETLGVIVGFSLTANLITQFGWAVTLYMTGVAGLTFSCIWCLLAFDSPSVHPRISAAERKYIESNLETTTKNIKYLINGVTIIKSTLAGVAACLVAVGHVGCDSTAAIAMLCLATVMSGVMVPGFYPSYTEITLGFSGVAFGISNSVNNCAGFIVPMMVGILTEENQTVAAWQKVFYVSAAISVSGSVMALGFLRTDPVSWAQDPDVDKLFQPARDKLINDQTVAAWQKVFYVSAAISVSGSVMALGFLRTDPVSWAQDPDVDKLFQPARDKLINDVSDREKENCCPVLVYETTV